MSFSINIHPEGYCHGWNINTIWAEVHGKDGGHCVTLNLGSYVIHIHYGDTANQYEFVSRLKEIIAALPNSCPTCGQ